MKDSKTITPALNKFREALLDNNWEPFANLATWMMEQKYASPIHPNPSDVESAIEGFSWAVVDLLRQIKELSCSSKDCHILAMINIAKRIDPDCGYLYFETDSLCSAISQHGLSQEDYIYIKILANTLFEALTNVLPAPISKTLSHAIVTWNGKVDFQLAKAIKHTSINFTSSLNSFRSALSSLANDIRSSLAPSKPFAALDLPRIFKKALNDTIHPKTRVRQHDSIKTQAEVARLCGVARATIIRWENKSITPSPPYRYSRELRLDPDRQDAFLGICARIRAIMVKRKSRRTPCNKQHSRFSPLLDKDGAQNNSAIDKIVF